MSKSTEIKAGRAYVELGVNDKMARGLAKASARLKSFGNVLKAALGFVAARAAFSAGVSFIRDGVAGMGGDMLDAAQRTGMSVEALSELKYAAEQSGSSLEGLETGVKKMQDAIVNASRGSKEAAASLARLGLSAAELIGLSPDEQFKRIADGLSQIEDPAQRTALAMDIFGRSGVDLLPLMNQGAAGIEKMIAKARELGLTMSTEDAVAAEEFGDKLDTLGSVLRMKLFNAGMALMPLLADFVELATNAAAKVSAWVKANRPLVVTVLKIAGAALAAGAALVALGVGISLVGYTIGGITIAFAAAAAVMGAILSPIGLVVAGLVGLAAYFLFATETGGKALTWLGEKFDVLKGDATLAMGGIADALAAGNFKLAAQILWTTLKLEWERGAATLEGIWLTWKHGFLGVAYDAFYSVKWGWIELTSALGKAWTQFTSMVKSGWESIINTVSNGMIDLFGFGLTEEEQAQAIAGNNEQSALNQEQIEQDKNRDLAANEAARQRDREKNSKDWLDKLGELDAKKKAAGAEADAEIAALREELKKLRGDAKAGRAGAFAGGVAEGEVNKIKAGVEEAKKAAAPSRGTFNAAAAQGLESAPVMDRIAKASERTAKNTDKLARRSGLAFS